MLTVRLILKTVCTYEQCHHISGLVLREVAAGKRAFHLMLVNTRFNKHCCASAFISLPDCCPCIHSH